MNRSVLIRWVVLSGKRARTGHVAAGAGDSREHRETR